MTAGRSDLIDIACDRRRVSPSGKAWLIHDGTREAWVPISACEWDGPDRGHGTLTLPEWLAKEKGLI